MDSTATHTGNFLIQRIQQKQLKVKGQHQLLLKLTSSVHHRKYSRQAMSISGIFSLFERERQHKQNLLCTAQLVCRVTTRTTSLSAINNVRENHFNECALPL